MGLRSKFLRFCWMLAGLWLGHLAHAAPYPGMGSSVLVNPEIGALFPSRGFVMNTKGTQWSVADDVPSNPGLKSSLRFFLKAEKDSGVSPSLSLHIDEMPAKLKLEQYAKKWIKEYSQFGFEILGSQNIQIVRQESLLIDLTMKGKAQQVRQVLVRDQGRVAIFTCRDSQENFLKTLPQCNQVVRSFEFLHSPGL